MKWLHLEAFRYRAQENEYSLLGSMRSASQAEPYLSADIVLTLRTTLPVKTNEAKPASHSIVVIGSNYKPIPNSGISTSGAETVGSSSSFKERSFSDGAISASGTLFSDTSPRLSDV